MNSIYNTHNSTGDIVTRDKIVNINQDLSNSDLKVNFDRALMFIRQKLYPEARQILDQIESIPKIAEDVRNLIDVIKVKIDLSQNKVDDKFYQKLILSFNNSSVQYSRDIALSALIRLDSLNEKLPNAQERYRDFQSPYHARETFFELVATEEEITQYFNDHRLTLTDVELCGLIRGALRLNLPDLATNIANQLLEIDKSENSQILSLNAAYLHFFKISESMPYWSISSDKRDAVIELCKKASTLLELTEGKDTRLPPIVSSLIEYTYCEYKKLVDVCWQYISVFENDFPDLAVSLRNYYEVNPKEKNNNSISVIKAIRDKSYQKEELEKILKKETVSYQEAFILRRFAEQSELRAWLDNKGDCEHVSQEERNFLLLELEVKCYQNSEEEKDIISKIDAVIKGELNDPKKIYQPRLLDFSELLIRKGFPIEASELLKKHVPLNGAWNSPLLRCYCRALLNGEQFSTLKSSLSDVPTDEWEDELWEINAQRLAQEKNYTEAIASINHSIRVAPSNSFYWILLIDFHRLKNSNPDEIRISLNKIPRHIFEEPSLYGYRLLSDITRYCEFEEVEKILLDWFAKDPYGNAINFTNFNFSFHFDNGKTDRTLNSPTPSNVVEKHIKGVCYKDEEGKKYTKIITSCERANKEFFVHVSSPLAETLINMKVGDVSQHGFKDITLLEDLPPYIAAVRISVKIRDQNNDGADCFYSFSLPQDDGSFLNTFEKKMKFFQDKDLFLEDNQNIPLTMRGFAYRRSSPVFGALNILDNHLTNKGFLNDFGDRSPTRVTVDIYTVIYLVITGLINAFLKSQIDIVITQETRSCLEEWLNEVNDEKFLSVAVAPEGGLIRTTKKDLEVLTARWQESIRNLLDQASIQNAKLVDTPPVLLMLQKNMDISVLSTLKLANSNNIPWFSIDGVLAEYIKAMGGIKIVDASDFIKRLSGSLSVDEKLGGLWRNVNLKLPFPIIIKDLFELAQPIDTNNIVLLTKIIRKSHSHFKNKYELSFLLSQLISCALKSFFYKKNFSSQLSLQETLSLERVIFACCYSAMKHKDEETVELRISLLIAATLKNFNHEPTIQSFICQSLTKISRGHFLNLPIIKFYLQNLLNSEPDNSNNS